MNDSVNYILELPAVVFGTDICGPAGTTIIISFVPYIVYLFINFSLLTELPGGAGISLDLDGTLCSIYSQSLI